MDSSFAPYGLEKDVEFPVRDHSIAWTHRRWQGTDIYFFANQSGISDYVHVTVRDTAGNVRIWQPADGGLKPFRSGIVQGKRRLMFRMSENESVFVIVSRDFTDTSFAEAHSPPKRIAFSGKWKLQFDTASGGPANPILLDTLSSWSEFEDPGTRYYSGSAIYTNTFDIVGNAVPELPVLHFDRIHNIASVRINGTNCGILWTRPYMLNIRNAIKPGKNEIQVEVSNTWCNRLIGDQQLSPEKRITWTTAPYRLANKPLLPAGIVGPVWIEFDR
jgi:hypothetical protein